MNFLVAVMRRRLIGALGYSLQGLKACFQNEEAFRVELALAVVLAPLSLLLADNYLELVLMLATLLVVLIVELLNSAVEAVVDRVGTERHELSGRAKDIGSAAVLLSMILFLVVWGLCLTHDLNSPTT